MSTVALIDNPRKRSSKRRTPPRYKSGPKKGQFMPKSARKRSTSKKRSTKRSTSKKRTRSYGPKRKTYIKSGPRKGQRKGNYVMKKAKRKSTRGKSVTVRKRYYTNPGSSFVLMNPRRRKGKIIEGVAQIAGLSAVAFGGALGTRKITKLVLRQHDVGWKGYVANGLVAVGAGLGVAFVTKMPDVGAAIAIGGGVATLIRIANEKTPPDSALHVGKAAYKKRLAQLGRTDHGANKGRSKKRALAGSYQRRPGNFGGSGSRGRYTPNRQQRKALGNANWASNFTHQVGGAQYVPA